MTQPPPAGHSENLPAGGSSGQMSGLLSPGFWPGLPLPPGPGLTPMLRTHCAEA